MFGREAVDWFTDVQYAMELVMLETYVCCIWPAVQGAGGCLEARRMNTSMNPALCGAALMVATFYSYFPCVPYYSTSCRARMRNRAQ